MGKKTVIVESPTKARTIERYLGRDYKVVSTLGHVRDLPKSSLGVDPDKDFTPDYQVIKGKAKTIKTIKDAVRDAEEIYLASDPDREGEAIAWHVAQLLGKPVKRIEFQEITKRAVTEAIKHPRQINIDRVNAYHARRVLDRLVGYKISPLMWRKIKPGLSAGRVQSVAVSMICQREEEIRAFVKEEYWTFEGIFKDKRGEQFAASLVRVGDKRLARPEERSAEDAAKSTARETITISSEAEAQKLVADIRSQSFKASEVNTRRQSRRPSPPFTTSTMQQDSARKLGWTARRTMQIAQQLYEGIDLGDGSEGLITYMRTDSVRVSSEAQGEARDEIVSRFGREYAPETPNIYKSKASAQEAHEAIRPTAITRWPEKIRGRLSPDQYKLYNLIFLRFLSSQMNAAEFETKSLEVLSESYVFRATVTDIVFKGFLAVYDERSSDRSAAGVLPQIDEGQNVPLADVKSEQHFTKPPPRYSDATLVKALEEHGIGRPSTYAPIIETIIARGYVVRVNRSFEPTEWGFVATEMMEHYFPNIVDAGFTSEMEENLDQIERGSIDWKQLMGQFYGDFKKRIAEAEGEKRYFKAKPRETEHMCDKCGAVMVLRHGKYGRFLACSAYPACSNIKNIDDKGNVIDKVTSEAGQSVDYPCPKCSKELVVKVSRWGTKFIGCTGYPKCDFTSELQTQCPKCSSELIKKRLPNRRVILVCKKNEDTNAAECDFVCWGKPLLDLCEVCGFWLAEQKIKGTERWRRYCTNSTCVNHKGIGDDDSEGDEGGGGDGSGAAGDEENVEASVD